MDVFNQIRLLQHLEAALDRAFIGLAADAALVVPTVSTQPHVRLWALIAGGACAF
jgi:hypothetical protein